MFAIAFLAGKEFMPTNSNEPSSGVGVLLPLLREAVKAVPSLKFALGVVGVVSAIGIIKGVGIDFRVAVFGTIIMVVLMVLLVVFASLTKGKTTHVRIAGVVLLWSFLPISILTALLLFTSAFFDFPRPLPKLFQIDSAERIRASKTDEPVSSGDEQPIPAPPENIPSIEKSGLKPLTDTDRAQFGYEQTTLAIKNETSKSLRVGFTYVGRPQESRASLYLHRVTQEIPAGEGIEWPQKNFGGPVHVSVFAAGVWTPTNKWLDLGIVTSRTLFVNETATSFECRVEEQAK